MSVAGLSETFDVEGHIEVEASQLPPDMQDDDVLRARKGRVDDVLIVLEHNQADLQRRLAKRVCAMMPEGVAAEIDLNFRAQEPKFDVTIVAALSEEVQFDRRGVVQALPEAVICAVTDYIDEKATRVGRWRPVVAAFVRPVVKKRSENLSAPGIPMLAKVAIILALGLVLAGALRTIMIT